MGDGRVGAFFAQDVVFDVREHIGEGRNYQFSGEIEPGWDTAREALLARMDVGKESFHQVFARMLGED